MVLRITKERYIKQMSEHIKGAYNVHEHNHIEWHRDALNERLKLLTDNMNNIRYTGERLHQVRREIGLIAFELSCRYSEETDQAWEEYERGEYDGKN